MISIYYSDWSDRIVLISMSECGKIRWDYGDKNYLLSIKDSIRSLAYSLYNYQLIGVYNEN
jgi:hypothetical protein